MRVSTFLYNCAEEGGVNIYAGAVTAGNAVGLAHQALVMRVSGRVPRNN